RTSARHRRQLVRRHDPPGTSSAGLRVEAAALCPRPRPGVREKNYGGKLNWLALGTPTMEIGTFRGGLPMRTRSRPRPTCAQTLTPLTTHCPDCGHKLWTDYDNYRTVTTLDTVTRLTLQIRRGPQPA